MSLSFGLNVKPKAGRVPPVQATPKKASIFDDSDSDTDAPAPKTSNEEAITSLDLISSRPSNSSISRPPKSTKVTKPPSGPPKPLSHATTNYTDLSSDRSSNLHAAAAESTDPSIYDYDSFHTTQTAVRESRKAAERQDALERKPKYINNLLDAAARRKQDQLVAREKVLQREREAEGDEFADKESFVTEAYKAAQNAAREAEAEEKLRREEEEARRKRMGGGMAGFYRGVLGDGEKRHAEEVKAAEMLARTGVGKDEEGEKEKSEKDLVEEMRAKGVVVGVNEEGQITDKRQLLSAGLNVAPNPSYKTSGKSSGAEHLRARLGAQSNPYRAAQTSGRDARERQTRQMEAQLEAAAKRKADEEDEERAKLERASKSRKTDEEKMGARERFLARKKEREEAARREKESGG
ncbi:hypothetical protein K461DRAFT_280590 [Myriangium duriaei CBS 260.36]|uniref:Nuclear speckle splicing regulatory protein 1 N-terminal domain-containing protein n=1 Tax=Myriangium duriaei CBS 260.36 TaxID=1168546 RepID=A0A9P4IY36_9PEZI|nr:hypothetical protein K461DRAFT_280590 [Myriangium duriaei CBS 260.36]